MRGQQQLEGTEVPTKALPIKPAVCALGLSEIHKIRAELEGRRPK